MLARQFVAVAQLVKLVLPRVAPAQPVAQSAAPAAKLARHPASVASAARGPCICRYAMPNAFIVDVYEV